MTSRFGTAGRAGARPGRFCRLSTAILLNRNGLRHRRTHGLRPETCTVDPGRNNVLRGSFQPSGDSTAALTSFNSKCWPWPSGGNPVRGAGTKQQTSESVRPIATVGELQITPGAVMSDFEQICVAMPAIGAVIAVRDLAGMLCTVSFRNALAVGSRL